MTDFRSLLSDLRRPALLIRAARFGMADYRRDRDLRRLIAVVLPPERSLPLLFELEERLEQTRRAGDASYAVNRHIDVLIALMGEARMLPRETSAGA